VLKARWDEFDLDQALVWSVPLANLKDRKFREEPFRVPLSSRAIDIVREMQAIRSSDFMFPGQASGKPFSNMALLTLLKRMNTVAAEKWVDVADGRPITAHGFRATFRTWAEEVTGFPHAVIEEAMGHQVGTPVERLPTYGRSREASRADDRLRELLRPRWNARSFDINRPDHGMMPAKHVDAAAMVYMTTIPLLRPGSARFRSSGSAQNVRH
jgi:integrase